MIPFLDQPHPLLSWSLAALGVLILGIAKSGFGGGVGIVAVPMFALAAGGAQQGSAILLPLLIAADIFSVNNHWKTWDTRILKLLLPGSILGILIGTALLYYCTKTGTKQDAAKALNLITGIICILYLVADQVRRRLAPTWSFNPTIWNSTLAGLMVGVISTLAHAAGPVAAIFLLGQHLPKQKFIGTTVIYFLIVNTLKIPTYVALDMLNLHTLAQAGFFLVFAPIGTYLGATICRKMSEPVFRTTILIVTFLTGVQLVTGFDPAAAFTAKKAVAAPSTQAGR